MAWLCLQKEWESEELAQVKVRVLQGHQKSVNKCMFLDNSKTHLLSCSSDKTCTYHNGGVVEIPAQVISDSNCHLGCSSEVNENLILFLDKLWLLFPRNFYASQCRKVRKNHKFMIKLENYKLA